MNLFSKSAHNIVFNKPHFTYSQFLLLIILCTKVIADNSRFITLEPNSLRSFFFTKSNNTLYFKIDRVMYNQSEAFLKPHMNGCRGRFNMFVKYCTGNCTNSENIPGPGNFDYIGIQTKWWTKPLQSLCYNRYSKCINDKIFYVAVISNTDELDFEVSLETFATDQDGEYGIVVPTDVIFLDLSSNIVINPVQYCMLIRPDGTCAMHSSKVLTQARYRIYYIVYPSATIHSYQMGNLGTVCGANKYATAYGEWQTNVKELHFEPNYPLYTKFYVGVMYEVQISNITYSGTYLPFDVNWMGVYKRQSLWSFIYEQYKIIIWLLVASFVFAFILAMNDAIKWYRDMRANGSPRWIFF